MPKRGIEMSKNSKDMDCIYLYFLYFCALIKENR